MNSDMSALKQLIGSHEHFLMKRLFHYATERNYAAGSATLEEAWRNCVNGLSGAIMEGIESKYPDFEFGPDYDFRHDPLCRYIVDTAKRHRERGVSLQMFHGLMVYYREAWLDLVRNAQFDKPYEDKSLYIINRMFDRFMIALCAEWAETGQSARIEELQQRNRRITVEKNRFLTIFESVPNPVFIADAENRITNFNLAAAVMIGAPESHGAQYFDSNISSPNALAENANSVIGRKITRLFPWLTNDLGAFIACDESSINFEREIETEKGIKYLSIKLSRRADVSKTFLGVIIIFEDVTEKKLVLEELRKAKEAAEAANRAKSSFLANMSHELRSPLNAVLGYSQLMQRDQMLQPGQREYLNIINRSGEHLLALINDVLEISKIEARRAVLNPCTFDLHAILHDLYVMFKIRTDEKNISFELDEFGNIPRCVLADEGKFRQVMINLLGNAVKFTEEGGITMRVAVKSDSAGTMRLAAEVRDTGMGIAAAELDKVFEYFEQTAAGKKNQSGTGLGLAISREYARLMGGDITISSRLGEGSAFRFEMQLQEGRESDLEARIVKRKVVSPAPGQAIPRILVVEDMEENRNLLVRLLESAGFDVMGAENGKMAIQCFESWSPHFIWMDIRMPVMDGREATRRIKASPGGDSVKIVALTASALQDEVDSILAGGCDDFVRKPFQESEIFQTMEKHLGLEYLYEPEPAEDASAAKGNPHLAMQLSALPVVLHDELRLAVIELDTSRILDIIGEISTLDAATGLALKKLAESFEYARLLTMLENDNMEPRRA